MPLWYDSLMARMSGPIGGVIREWRERRELTQRELAAKSGLHFTSIGAYERGERSPQLDALAKICFALDVEPSAFCLEVARAEARQLAPLVDQLKRQAGLEMPDGSQHAGRVEELRWASDLVFNSMRDVFVFMVSEVYGRKGNSEGAPGAPGSVPEQRARP